MVLQHDPSADKAVTVHQLSTMLADRSAGLCDFDLIDVREPGEYEIVSIPGSRLIPQDRIFSGIAPTELHQDRDIILHCKSGMRSAAVLAELAAQGYTRVEYLQGGVLAWVKEMEPTKPAY
jgi:adenylyltransferase/sulfurtransferase